MVETFGELPPRPRYRERQRLRFSDLALEQGYREAVGRRHLIGPHDWGIVRGLRIEVAQGRLTLAPGVAVDGHGRELLVPRRVEVPVRDLPTIEPPAALDLWLLYGRREIAGAAPRWLPEARLRIAAAEAADNDDAPKSGGATENDEPGPWPVFLGRLAASEAGYIVLPTARRHARAVAGSVTSADGARLDLVDEAARAPRLAVELPDSSGRQVPRWTVSAGGRSRIDGRLRIAGELALEPGTHPPTVRWREAPPAPLSPAGESSHCRIHRAQGPSGDQQLRFQLASSGEPGSANSPGLAIGTGGSAAGFQSGLRVSADRTTTVTGHLIVEGRWIESPIKADPDDDRFIRELGRQRSKGSDAALIQSLRSGAPPPATASKGAAPQ